MKTKITLILILSHFFCGTDAWSQCANNANIYSFTYNGKNYEIVKEMKTWADAAICAVERGGYLVEINDQNEQTAVYNAISSAGVSTTYTTISNGGGIAYVWIGGTDQASEGIWLWDGNNDASGTNFWTGQGANGLGNGAAVDGLYSNWGGKSTATMKEPDNYGSGQHHAAIGLAGWPSGTTMLGIPGEWNDIIGSGLLYFVIEKDNNNGINDRNNPKEIRIYPNPCTEILVVERADISEECSFEVYDITGKLLAKELLDETKEIDTQGLTQGLYYLKIVDNSSTVLLKFIKI